MRSEDAFECEHRVVNEVTSSFSEIQLEIEKYIRGTSSLAKIQTNFQKTHN
jgi:hypothetical protein